MTVGHCILTVFREGTCEVFDGLVGMAQLEDGQAQEVS
jgi:hypothetical protein